MRKVLKGFTILETVIAMMLTAMLAVLAVTGLGFLQRTFGVVTDVGVQIREINMLYGAMISDMERAEKVTFGGELLFDFCENPLVVYEVLEDRIVRTSELQADTFFVCGIIEEMAFANDSSSLVSFLLLHCSVGELVYPVSFQKDYTLGLLLQN